MSDKLKDIQHTISFPPITVLAQKSENIKIKSEKTE